jgi:hypothetical protein
MLTRFFLGLIKGALAGGLVALALVKGFGVVSWGGTLAYLTAMGLGVLTALVSGNAIWRRGAGVENAIKAVAGIGIACVGMFALRKWLPFSVDLSMFQAGSGKLGDLPAAALPMVGTLLALMFEIDNTGGSQKEQSTEVASSKARVAGSVRVDELGPAESELASDGRGAHAARRDQRR